jgi:hypothetical protein
MGDYWGDMNGGPRATCLASKTVSEDEDLLAGRRAKR